MENINLKEEKDGKKLLNWNKKKEVILLEEIEMVLLEEDLINKKNKFIFIY
jgi:hypothetical protein